MNTTEVLAAALGYLAGSVPFAFVLARRHGVDLRRVGSGNVGATNVLRTRGVPMAVTAMCLDAAKGSLAVLLAQRFDGAAAAPVTAGLAAIVGHMYPPWLGFRGGKGVATAAGVFGVLAPPALAVAAAVFLAAVTISRYISVGSLAGAVALTTSAFAMGAPGQIAAGSVVAAVLIVHRHRGNVARLIGGSERRVGLRL